MWKASGSRNKWCSIACWKEYSNTFLFGKVTKLQKKSSLPVRPAVWCSSHFKPRVFRIFLLRVLKQNGDLSHCLVMMMASNNQSPKTSKNMLRHWSQITLPETKIEGWKIHQCWWYLPGRMWIFHGYVSLQEGISLDHPPQFWWINPAWPTGV